jgi:TRAP-type mannitol/chloroaromatic compound transport system substrate-binding protein
MATTSATSLAGLKLTAAHKSANISPVQQRRNKMSKRIWEQIQLATAQANGSQFAPVKFRSFTDAETGLRRQVEVPKRVKAWWFTADNGKTAISVRYGARVLELAKGKFAVEVSAPAELVPTLEVIKAAVEAGELDTQMEAVASRVLTGFKR